MRLPPRSTRLLAASIIVAAAIAVAFLGTPEHNRPGYHHYVALGDSYTSAPFVPLTDMAYGCMRSNHNYPHLVAQALRIEDLRDRSCSGAKTRDLVGSQTTSRGMQVPPQLDALTHETDLVTVGIGFNNGYLYARMNTVCRLSRAVCRLADQRATLLAIVTRVRPALVESLAEIRRRAPDARVLLVSYPKLLPPRGTCPELPRMRPQDRRTFREMSWRLRNQMQAAAEDAGVEFVDFYTASLGHDVCSDDAYVQGRIGSRRVGAALHPLASGQRALARIIEEVLAEPPDL